METSGDEDRLAHDSENLLETDGGRTAKSVHPNGVQCTPFFLRRITRTLLWGSQNKHVTDDVKLTLWTVSQCVKFIFITVTNSSGGLAFNQIPK